MIIKLSIFYVQFLKVFSFSRLMVFFSKLLKTTSTYIINYSNKYVRLLIRTINIKKVE